MIIVSVFQGTIDQTRAIKTTSKRSADIPSLEAKYFIDSTSRTL